MTGLRLSPEESARLAPEVEFLNGYVAGTRDMAEQMKRRRLNEILAARQQAPAPQSASQVNENAG